MKEEPGQLDLRHGSGHLDTRPTRAGSERVVQEHLALVGDGPQSMAVIFRPTRVEGKSCGIKNVTVLFANQNAGHALY
jgi:hypothetical protein